jgi:hypothetical protein
MKKLFTIACTLVIGGVLAFAQTGGTSGSTGGQTPAGGDQTQTASHKGGKKATKTKSHHKGGKKSKKGSESTTPPPK